MENTIEGGKFLDPKALLAEIGIGWGSIVADFGCGSGYFSIALAEVVGSDGKVFALDILKSSLESVESRAKILGLANVVSQRVNLEKDGGSKLNPESLDWVIMKDMLFQNQDKRTILREAYRVIKPGGRMLVVEWRAENRGVGPEAGIRVSEDEIQKLGEAEKFSLEKRMNAGDYHYALVFKK